MLVLTLFSSGCAILTGRTAGEIIDDSSITTAINMKIIGNEELQYLKINVNSFRGHVTLGGTVPSKGAEKQLIEIVKGVRGVQEVTSNLIIEEK
jgi:hyperosmotically inducible protein